MSSEVVEKPAMTNEAFFTVLDKGFRNFENVNEPFLFQTKDSLVQWYFELPIPTLPGSVVKYSKFH